MQRPILLTGMMATGKTTVGRELARRLRRPFVDLDASIETEAGMSIAAIFERFGEAAFRAREREGVRSLVGAGAGVISTGGWTVGDPANRAVLESLGSLVCLTATPDALAARLATMDPAARPVLAGSADPDFLRALLDQRRPVYNRLPWHVDTTGRDVATVADLVQALVRATADLTVTALPVRTPSGGYSVLVGAGLLDALGQIVVARGLTGQAAIVSDPNVNALYGERVRQRLVDSGLQVTTVEMDAGEHAKSLATVADLYDVFLAADLDRDATVVALGGGVVGDTAGFAAATYLRGVCLVHVPTTLLAMVDASVGGKTGVDLPAGKNLVGAFHHPALVVADPTVLASLPDETLRAGLAEVVKEALIADPSLLDEFAEVGAPDCHDATAWARIVTRAAAVKAAIVSEDPTEHGRRTLLNLGHTFAHALERATDYRMSHGDAVAVGLVASARLAGRLGIASPVLAEDVEAVLSRLGLPVRYVGPEAHAVVAAMAPDKKRHAGRLRFVVPRAPGDVVVVDDVAQDDVVAVLAEVRGRG